MSKASYQFKQWAGAGHSARGQGSVRGHTVTRWRAAWPGPAGQDITCHRSRRLTARGHRGA
eukprot:5880785-Alexandrium_andersonii.AAC.1